MTPSIINPESVCGSMTDWKLSVPIGTKCVKRSVGLCSIVIAALGALGGNSISADPQANSNARAVRDALVVVFSTDPRSTEVGSGFLLGDQSCVVTAWHNTVRQSEKGIHRKPVILFVASPYFGDVFVGEVVASDPVKDIAILHVDWAVCRPHLNPAQERPDLGQDVFAASFSSPRTGTEVSTDTGGPTPNVHVEHLRVSKPPEDIASVETLPPWEMWFSQTRSITHGWSGCPVLNSDLEVEGMLTRLSILQITEGDAKANVELYPAGASMEDIRSLLPAVTGPQRHVPAQPDPQSDAPEAFKCLVNAVDALCSRKAQEAKANALRFVNFRPNSPVARIIVADILGHTAELARAEENVNEARDLAPDNPTVHLYRGNVLMAADKHKDGLEAFRKAVELQPSNLTALQYLLVALERNGKYAEAERIGRMAVARMPENAIVRAELACVLGETGQSEEAIQMFREAIRLYPEHHPYRRFLGRVLEKAGQYDEAEAQYIQLTDLEPENPVVWYWYATFLANHRPQEEARAREALKKIESLNIATPHPISADQLEELRRQINSGAGMK